MKGKLQIKRKVAGILVLLMLVSEVGSGLSYPFITQVQNVYAEEEENPEIVDVTQYTYEITPLLAPFMNCIYVKTDNPDPFSFRFLDADSVYLDEYDTAAVYTLLPYDFADVEYESETSYRVGDGYIFASGSVCSLYVNSGETAASDGGELILQQNTGDYGYNNIISGSGWGSYIVFEYENTDVTVMAPDMIDYLDYLLQTYTSEEQSFFEKMDAIQNGLDEISVYPREVRDSDLPTDWPYPLLAASPYEELSLNEHYEGMFAASDGMLLSYAYPYVLNSLGFPGTMTAIARKLEPSVQVSAGDVHWLVDVTYEGETRTYGGAGGGGRDPLYTKHIEKLFTFDGSEEDFANDPTLEKFCEQLLSYQSVACQDAAEYEDLIAGETFVDTITATGGTWIQILTEGLLSFGMSYAYVIPLPMWNSYRILSDAWVDGRYISTHEIISAGTFADHPTASIVIQDMTYTDAYGEVHTQDVIYDYDSGTDTWIAGPEFHGYYWSEDLPEEFVLTRDEVEAMSVDEQVGVWPEEGLIYDGSVYPGTPFKNTPVSGIQVPENVIVGVGETVELSAEVLPEDAFDTSVTWTSDDETIAEIGWESVTGIKEGTTTLTATTYDGKYSATCTVTVIQKSVQTYEGPAEYSVYLGDDGFYLTGRMNGDGMLTYESTNPEVVTVSDTGFVEIVGEGMACITITASSTDQYMETTQDIYIFVYPERPKGDVNGDGIVDTKDVIMLKRYIAGWNVDIDLNASDMDKDGNINLKDVALLKRYVAGWNVEL